MDAYGYGCAGIEAPYREIQESWKVSGKVASLNCRIRPVMILDGSSYAVHKEKERIQKDWNGKQVLVCHDAVKA